MTPDPTIHPTRLYSSAEARAILGPTLFDRVKVIRCCGPAKEWFAVLRFAEGVNPRMDELGGTADLYGPIRPSRREALIDAKELRCWWRSRP